MRRFVGVLLLGALLVGCGGGSNGNKIAFSSDRDGDWEIFVMNADGNGVQQLTDNDGDDSVEEWSPNGNKIAFVSDRDGDDEIFVMNADGTEVRQLTDNDDRDGSASWSLDGDRIAFTSNRDGDWDIFVMNADGTDSYSTGQMGSDPSFGG